MGMGMRDETLIEPFAVQEIFVNGFTDHILQSGVMTCAGYRLQPTSGENGGPLKVVVVRLVWPAAATEEAIAAAKHAQILPDHPAKMDGSRRH